ncbi:hypothetical protein HHL28_05850 [Aerophototrophica crusticola]|uniref:Uncharacterized protein n=1 Tax=Aerophototrophica crusticola TaxID=1709002 RepID=A0A858R5M6_9PROT|nr:hypothetical protein HHL28_05850 [Rhodospirillaceae bacterium B3]
MNRSRLPVQQPTAQQRAWLRRGLDQAGGKLPLFDKKGGKVPKTLVRRCIELGWAEPWFANPTMPDWMVCRLTEEGRRVATENGASPGQEILPGLAELTDTV